MKQSNNETMSPVHFESLFPADSRAVEIAQIVGFVKSGFSAVLIGLPGIGRATILRLLTYNTNVRIKHLGENQKWFHFVHLSFGEMKNRNLSDVTKFIFLTLTDSLRDRGMNAEHDRLHVIFEQYSQQNDELVLFQGLKEAMDVLTLEKELAIIFLLDRFEEYSPGATPEFFSQLRILRDRAKYRFSVVFSVPRPLEDLVDTDTMSAFYEFVAGHDVHVCLLDRSTTDFRIAYIEKTHSAGSPRFNSGQAGQAQKIDKETIEAIYQLTAGHGKLTKIAVEELLANPTVIAIRQLAEKQSHEIATSSDEHRSPRDDALILFLLQSKPIQKALFDIWNFLTPSEQNVIARNRMNDEAIPACRQAGQDRDRHASLAMTPSLIEIPLFQQFLQSEMMKEKIGTSKITYDSEKNLILQGDTVLSHNLTALEFRLLAYLLQHPDITIERETVIQEVWRETKSTAGVTDQALDQLVFRLRQKIEDNPNTPIHIRTVKGRGLQFTA